jgi:hypothetical protein
MDGEWDNKGHIMKYFAKIENEVVKEVVVLDEASAVNAQEYLNGIGLHGFWLETDYDGALRGKYANIGDRYDSEKDLFVSLENEEYQNDN